MDSNTAENAIAGSQPDETVTLGSTIAPDPAPFEVRRESELRYDFNLMTQEALAKLLDVQLATLAAWRRDSKGPDFVRLGTSIYYRKQDVDAWINANVVVVNRAA